MPIICNLYLLILGNGVLIQKRKAILSCCLWRESSNVGDTTLEMF